MSEILPDNPNQEPLITDDPYESRANIRNWNRIIRLKRSLKREQERQKRRSFLAFFNRLYQLTRRENNIASTAINLAAQAELQSEADSKNKVQNKQNQLRRAWQRIFRRTLS